MSARGSKLVSRIRAGGVVIPKSRIAKEAKEELGSLMLAARKIRVIGLPNRKAASLKHGKR